MEPLRQEQIREGVYLFVYEPLDYNQDYVISANINGVGTDMKKFSTFLLLSKQDNTIVAEYQEENILYPNSWYITVALLQLLPRATIIVSGEQESVRLAQELYFLQPKERFCIPDIMFDQNKVDIKPSMYDVYISLILGRRKTRQYKLLQKDVSEYRRIGLFGSYLVAYLIGIYAIQQAFRY